MKVPECSKKFMERFVAFAERVGWDVKEIQKEFCATRREIYELKRAVETRRFIERTAKTCEVNFTTDYNAIQPTHYSVISRAPKDKQLLLSRMVAERKWTVRRLKEEIKKLRGWKVNKDLFPTNIWPAETVRLPYGSGEFRGNCSGTVPMQVILRYVPEAEFVIDPMAGSGTTLDVCDELGVECKSFDILDPPMHDGVEWGDATEPWKVEKSADLVFCHFPYWNMIQYTSLYGGSKERDISQYSYNRFLEASERILLRAKENLKPDGYVAVMIGDLRRNGRFYDLPAEFSKMGQRHFLLYDKVVKVQARETSRGYNYGGPLPFCRINFETILVFKRVN